MKRTPKMLAALLTAALAAAPVLSAAAAAAPAGQTAGQGATDTQGHWAREAISQWMANGVAAGYPDGTFKPDGSITRAEFATLINKVFGFSGSSGQPFSDVKEGAWYQAALSSARSAGYYEGSDGNKALPLAAISRQDAAAMLSRVFQLEANDSASGSLTFIDSAQISGYARKAVQALAGIVSGYPDGSFRPSGDMTRAEAVILLNKLVAGYYAQAGTSAEGKVAGNALVNHDGVVLKGLSISGNLYLTPGIGSGDATLDGVKVAGKTFLAGGGPNSVHIRDSRLNEVLVNRPDGQVRVWASGTEISRLVVGSPSKVELEGGTKVGSVEINAAASITASDSFSIGSLAVNVSGATWNGIAIERGVYYVENGALKPSGSPLPTATPAPSTPPAVTPAPTAAPTAAPTVNPSPTAEPTATPAPTAAPSPTTAPTPTPAPTVTPAPPAVNLVDRNASAQTRSLFLYLNELRGKNILFGQQHATTEGLSITDRDGTQSDAKNAVGDYPALFGWDTLSLEGKEKPGVAGDFEQSRDNLVGVMKKAYDDGGVLTLSSHMPNFVTGGSFYDVKGNVVSHILPGGDKNAEFNAFLDNIADFAHHLKDDDGNPIPVIFRPFHEQNGSWFWWGAAFTTKDEYKEIYRYTVEYLRDKKEVRNFLYGFSPGGGFGTDESRYMETYPGDDYADIIGFDSYYNGEGQTWFDGVVTEARTVSGIADARGKVAALTEFGYQKMKTSGNSTPDFFTKLSAALQSDPDAIRMAYMLTWANFGPDSTYVPYPLPDGQENQMLPDFIQFYNEPYSLFAAGVTGAYNRKADTSKEQPFVHVASPTDQSTIRSNTAVIRVRVLDAAPSKAVYLVEGSNREMPLTLDAATGYYTAVWSPAGSLNGKTAALTVKVYGEDGSVLHEQTNTVFVKVPEIEIGTYDFESGIQGVQNNGGYQASVDAIDAADFNGSAALKLTVSDLVYSDTWQEMKLELKNAKEVAGSADLGGVKRIKFEAYVPVSAGAKSEGKGSLQAVGQLPPDWEDKYGMGTTQVSLSDLPIVAIGGVDYYRYTPVIDFANEDKLKQAGSIALSIVGSGLNADSSIPVYIDNIKLYSTYADAVLDPAMVDDFEGYLGSNEALGSKFVHAGGDSTSTALDSAHKSSGSYGLKYTYTLAGSGYAGITKSLGGVDWSGFNALQFWYQPDGKGQKLVMQINADGKTYEYYPDTTGTEAKLIIAPFNEFAPANGATGTLTKLKLANVQAFSIYTNAVPNGNQLTGSMYFDDIKALTDPNAGTVPNGSANGGLPLGVLYDFESSASSWSVDSNGLNLSAPALEDDGAGKALGSAIPASVSGEATSELTRYGALDFTNASRIKVKARISGGSASAQLFIKHGSGWAWASSGTVQLTDEYQWITLDLNGTKDANGGKIDKSFIQAVGVQIAKASGGGKVFIDDVTLE